MRRTTGWVWLAAAVTLAVTLGGCASVAVPEVNTQRTEGDVRLPAVFGPNMVLQRNKPITVWGWAEPGQQVQVWLADRHGQATADDNGRWQLSLKPLPAGGPHRMIVAGQKVYAIENVMIGEVWLCSGQSNMQWTVRQSADADREIAAANYPDIRLFQVPRKPASQPVEDVDAAWVTCSPQTVANFSAVAYYFGRELHKELNVPIGLIDSSWGGTIVEAWTPRDAFLRDQTALRYVGGAVPESVPFQGHPNFVTVLYNGMIAPLAPFGIRGAIWYQGEANIPRAYQYEKLLSTLIEGWRRVWFDRAGDDSRAARRQRDFSFYLVQIAPFNYNHPPEWLAELREAQLRVMQNVANTGMAVITDIGNLSDIHPTNKQEVGRRLALWALAKDYGRNIVYSGPIYREMKVEGDKIRIYFDHVDGGLVCKGDKLTWWQIAPEDGEFVEAQAVIEGDTVVVSSPEVKRPAAVRFGWHHSAEPNLFNKAGLPASPFRTDSRPRLTEK